MKSRLVGAIAFLVVLVGGASAAPSGFMGIQPPPDESTARTLQEMENRIAGLEARVTQLEQQVGEGSAGGTVESEENSTHDLTGTFSIFYNLSADEGDPCTGEDSRSDQDFSGVKEGAVLTVYDSERNEIASGALSAGTIKRVSVKASDGTMAEGATCVFSFAIPNIPDSDTYVITFSAIDGDMILTREELGLRGWHLELG